MSVFRKLRALIVRSRLEREMAEEMRHHLEAQVAKHVAGGASAAAAHKAAEASFGGMERIKEESREQRRWRRGEEFLQDVGFALRLIRRRPVASAVIVLSAGLAIGANTGAFSVVNAFLLRSWNADGMERVVRVREDYAGEGQPPDIRGFTLGNLAAWRRENTVFEGLAAGTGASFILGDAGAGPTRVSGGRVTANFFSVLGFRPALGRLFQDDEDAPGRNNVVLLGDAIWRAQFNADPAVLGKTISLNGTLYTIVGVMPRGLKHPYQSDLWIPLAAGTDNANPAQVYAPARLKPGLSLAKANEELDRMVRRLHAENPGPRSPTGAQVTLLRPEMLGRLDSVLYLVGGAAFFVLLIAMANVSNLLLAQSIEQGGELAVRVALGATRTRLVRPFVAYSLILAGCGGLAGTALAHWSVGPLVALSPAYGSGEFDIVPRLDWQTLVFTAAVTVAAGTLFGIVPAIRASRVVPNAALRDNTRTSSGGAGARRWLRGLVIWESALAFVLILCAAALGRGLLDLRAAPWGFERRGAVTFSLELPDYKYGEGRQRSAFVTALAEQLRRMPGVTAAAASTVLPLETGTDEASFNMENAVIPQRGFHLTQHRIVSPGYFAAMQIPIRSGRDFDDRDSSDTPRVVVVSESMAQRYWPGESALGKRVKVGPIDGPAPWMEIVGVVGTLRETESPDLPPGDAWYLAQSQVSPAAFDRISFVIRGSGGAGALIAEARGVLQQLDRDTPMSEVMTMEERFDRYTATERLATGLAAALGGIGLFLAAIGVYALLAFSLGRRSRELGIRAALGATPRQVRWLIAREALAVLGAGMAIGGVCAFAARPLLRTDFFPAAGYGPAVIAAAVAGLALMIFAASALPAIRAGRVNPTTALKVE